MQRQKEMGDTRRRRLGAVLKEDLFRANRLLVTVDVIDRVEHLLPFGVEDSLMVGADYSHSDPSANLAALQEVGGQPPNVLRSVVLTVCGRAGRGPPVRRPFQFAGERKGLGNPRPFAIASL